ncbi:MAG: tRNA (N(6)-L-threonylcarbamoyladenosine(37)-C(2))-methylthiotransferase MtaB [Gammaproteobacteria bacterium]|nr:tRNA (N(6)-L-threonylcarbamoyladenosine(37)-C(2))-methylthiotransferase MtaB [Gammaproteobacteria bacterium]MCY4219115.1 tRNA (N(6)-L-threonylcarbamoyladenosine(37)-C(2))-methylthiotransferase MtaB [Gammaproteobacteria bacterium]MCY4274114.1 tRNA (N(6)-L-threonylcarbamoyladenosine(37)-C(2))-methylthiotransferase MtaB [Gammaproteobacteria bacterium]
MTSIHVDIPESQPRHQSSAAVITLGCKVNTFESEHIASGLEARGFKRAPSNESADLFVINTCTVTAEADRQTRQLIRRTIRNHPAAKVVVTGCYAEIAPEICADIPGVDMVVGNSRKLQIPELITHRNCSEESSKIQIEDIHKHITIPNQLIEGYEGKSRAFIQVQQGCDQGCTFCIIHTARGPNRSFSVPMIKRQCKKLFDNDYKEIVLSGVDIGSYGSDIDDDVVNLSGLIKHILQIEGDYQIRLSSIDPVHITDQLIDLMVSEDRICKHLHLSMQSGNTLILKRMKRRATREMIYERVGALRKRLSDLVLSADVLVGFPTESDQQFMDTIKAIDELEIAYPHVFSYSPREGTPASRIPSQVSKEVKKSRSKIARDQGALVWERLAKKIVGRDGRVLIENKIVSKELDQSLGRMSNYHPVVCNGVFETGTWQNIKIVKAEDGYLEGIPSEV